MVVQAVGYCCTILEPYGKAWVWFPGIPVILAERLGRRIVARQDTVEGACFLPLEINLTPTPPKKKAIRKGT